MGHADDVLTRGFVETMRKEQPVISVLALWLTVISVFMLLAQSVDLQIFFVLAQDREFYLETPRIWYKKNRKGIEYLAEESGKLAGKRGFLGLYYIFKTRQLAHYLVGKKKTLDLVSPKYQIDRQDSDEIRKKILSIPYTQWKKRGFSKGTLNYLKQNAEGNKPFTLNKHVRERLNMWQLL